jgi:hypothetical protein
MKSWIPPVAAVVIGLVLAGLLFWPRGETSTVTTPTAGGSKPTVTVTNTSTTRSAEGSVSAPNGASPVEGSGSLGPDPNRQTTPAEQALQARLGRPFNQHTQRAVAYWGQASKFATQEGATEIGAEMNQMDDYLDGQAGLAVGELDAAAAIQKELDLVAKVRAAHLKTPEIAGMMDYIEASAKVALAGGDPRTVVRPTAEQLQVGTYVPTTATP